MNSSQFFCSFHQTHDKNTNKFKFDFAILEVEKQAKQGGSMILRQVQMFEHYMQQVDNQKIIPYPENFIMVTKDAFDNLPQQDKKFFPWTKKLNKNVRVFFDRQYNNLNNTIMRQFVKPTAVYFDSVQDGYRFMEFLKFRNQKKQDHCKAALLKIKKHWEQKMFHLLIQKSNKQLKELTQKMSFKHKFQNQLNIYNSVFQLSLRQLGESMQDPKLYEGTLTDIIDPFKQRSDDELKEAINKCCLSELIEQRNILETIIKDNGDNLSAGQLICIARAVLKKSPIVLIDETTTSIDTETEYKIEKTIPNSFKECTVIIIAHRINTILHCDKILVLDKGEVREFGYTKDLLNQTDSLFYGIYQEALREQKP